jgi:hypothetical protein
MGISVLPARGMTAAGFRASDDYIDHSGMGHGLVPATYALIASA